MAPSVTRRLVGAASVALGVSAVVVLLYSPLRGLWVGHRETGTLALELTLCSLMAVPGVLAAAFGIRLLTAWNAESLKWVAFSLAVIGTLWLWGFMIELFPDLFPEMVKSSAFLSLSSLTAIAVYIFAVNKMLHHMSDTEATCTPSEVRGILVLMAWQLWFLLISLFDEYSPIKAGSTHLHEEPWETLGFVVPIAVAYGSYRFLASLLANDKEMPEVGKTNAIHL